MTFYCLQVSSKTHAEKFRTKCKRYLSRIFCLFYKGPPLDYTLKCSPKAIITLFFKKLWLEKRNGRSLCACVLMLHYFIHFTKAFCLNIHFILIIKLQTLFLFLKGNTLWNLAVNLPCSNAQSQKDLVPAIWCQSSLLWLETLTTCYSALWFTWSEENVLSLLVILSDIISVGFKWNWAASFCL